MAYIEKGKVRGSPRWPGHWGPCPHITGTLRPSLRTGPGHLRLAESVDREKVAQAETGLSHNAEREWPELGVGRSLASKGGRLEAWMVIRCALGDCRCKSE